MARTGTPSIIKLSRHIARILNKHAAFDLASKTTPEMAAAILALVAAVTAFEALDDYPGEIDSTGPSFGGDPDL